MLWHTVRTLAFARRLVLALSAAAWLSAAPAAAEPPMRITPEAGAESNSGVPNDTPDAADKAAREDELQRLRTEQRKAAENQLKLAAEIDAIGKDRRKFSTD